MKQFLLELIQNSGLINGKNWNVYDNNQASLCCTFKWVNCWNTNIQLVLIIYLKIWTDNYGLHLSVLGCLKCLQVFRQHFYFGCKNIMYHFSNLDSCMRCICTVGVHKMGWILLKTVLQKIIFYSVLRQDACWLKKWLKGMIRVYNNIMMSRFNNVSTQRR